jgi:hypothetical protein
MKSIARFAAAGLVAAIGLAGVTACAPTASPSSSSGSKGYTIHPEVKEEYKPTADVITDAAWENLDYSSRLDICNLYSLSPSLTKDMAVKIIGPTWIEYDYSISEGWEAFETVLITEC